MDSQNVTYFKGVRQRFEFPGITLIAQCDLKRSLQVQGATKHYMIVSTDAPPRRPVPSLPSRTSRPLVRRL